MIVNPTNINSFLPKNDKPSINSNLVSKNDSLRSTRKNDLEMKLNPKAVKHDVAPPFRTELGLKPELSTHRDTFRNPVSGTFLY